MDLLKFSLENPLDPHFTGLSPYSYRDLGIVV